MLPTKMLVTCVTCKIITCEMITQKEFTLVKTNPFNLNKKLENLRRSNFDAAYKNVSDMCNVQNNDLDLPMRVYQKASKQKNITHFMFWLLFTSPVASVLEKLKFIHFLTFPACFLIPIFFFQFEF